MNNSSISPNPAAQDDTINPQRVFWAAIIFTAVALISFVFSFFLINRSPVWQVYAISAITAAALAVDIIGLILIWRGRLEQGLKYLFWSTLYTVPPNALLVTNTTPVLIAMVLAVGGIHLFYLQPRSWRRRYQFAPIVASVLMALVEVMQPAFRFEIAATGTGTRSSFFGPFILIFLIISLVALVVRQAWSRSLTIARKLYIAFGLLLSLVLVLAFFSEIALGNVQEGYENTIAGGVQIQNRSDHLNSELLEARRREKDFLLRWQTEGFDTAYQSYVVLNRQHTSEMKTTLLELGTLAPVLGRITLPDYSQDQYVADIANLNQQVVTYEQEFARAVSLLEERGFVDTGLEGEFRRSVQAIEAQIYDREGLDPLVITMLQIRRREKDFLLRGDQQYVDNVTDLIAELKSQTQASDQLTDSEKTEISGLADNYLANFYTLVNKEREAEAAIETVRAAAANIQNTTIRLESAGERLADLDIQTAEANATQAFVITGVIAVILLIASLILAVFMSQQLTRPIVQLTNTAQEISTGRFDLQAQVTSGDEIGTLAQTFNIMTERLGQAFEDVRRRAAELATVADVSTATSTILESQRLLQEVVDLTKERFNLYHSHIYLLDEGGRNLVLTAGAGEPGRIMSAEKRSIPVSREQSLVARAARERKGVTVNDVTQAPDFLPNPLLPNTRSELAVPMIVGGTVIGVFDIQSDQVGRFTESDVSIQTTLASQLATSIQNVRSFERTRKQADLEARVNLIGQRIQRATSIEETLQVAVKELSQAVGAARTTAKIQPPRETE